MSRRRAEAPPVEEEEDIAEMEVEEEVDAPTINVGEEQKKRAKAMKSGEMRARVSLTLVLAVFLAFPPFQRERVEEMGFGEIIRIDRMRVDPALTHALRRRWDVEAAAFVFTWGHMIPNLEDVSQITWLRIYGRVVSGFTYPCYQSLVERLLGLPLGHRSSLVPRVALQESLGLYEAGKNVGESEDEYLERLVRVSQRELASEPEAQADLDLRRFLILLLGRLLFATRGDAVHCRFLPLLEDLAGSSPFFRFGPIYTSQPWGEGISHDRALCPLHAVGIHAEIHAISGTNWSDYRRLLTATLTWMWFGSRIWGRVMRDSRSWCRPTPTSRSLELRQSTVEFPTRDQFRRPGRSFRVLHDTTDWRERAKEQIQNWERRGKAVKSTTTTDDAYLQAYALKYGGKVDVAGEITSLRALLYSAMQDQEAAQRQAAELRGELERVRSTGAGGASSSRGAGGSPSLLEAQLARAVLRAKEAQRHLEERERDFRLTKEHAMDLLGQRDQFQGHRDQLQGEIQTTRSERDQLRIRAEAAEAQVAEATRELEALRVQRSPVDQEEVTRLCTELLAQQEVVRRLQEIMTAIGRSHRRSRSGASGNRATGASVGQYLAGSSSRRRNEEEERRRWGETSAQSSRGGGEMPPPPDR
ncbi:hypothetical protein Taro_006482 [Colocasia esculenta]|uniref:Aminotransferase-like plant mobile domain-containing protein n=1 Tax=Colocasia esculenta TaxID=4460 RepID=A0A843TSL0_COLES|nr:hypothetical protein [Colocasia esculenta]